MLKAPEVLATVSAGARLLVAHHDPADPNRVVLDQATAADYRAGGKEPVFQVDLLEQTQRIPGDSGGVWRQGWLVGNNWAVERTIDPPSSQSENTETALAAEIPALLPRW